MITTRTIGLAAGTALLVLGAALVSAASVVHLTWALPLAELPFRPGVVDGETLAGLGLLLLLVSRRRAVGPTAVRDTALRLARGSAIPRP